MLLLLGLLLLLADDGVTRCGAVRLHAAGRPRPVLFKRCVRVGCAWMGRYSGYGPRTFQSHGPASALLGQSICLFGGRFDAFDRVVGTIQVYEPHSIDQGAVKLG